MRLVWRGVRTLLVLCLAASFVAACGDTAGPPTPEGQLLNAGLAAQASGHDQAALDYFQQVLKQDPSNKYALYDIGLIYQKQSKTAAAEGEYRAALISDPNYVPALFNLAILRTKEAPYESIDLYRHIIALQAGYAEAHLNLGYVLRDVAQVSEGNAEIAKALQLKPSLASPGASPVATPSS